MVEDIELSFCIPTYNNAKSLHRLVLSILRCGDSNIEVALLDNGSTDETLKIISEIDDERLRVYSNGKNMGALFNMVNVLDKGRGKYLVFMTDHDHVDPEKISKFKHFLLENTVISCGYCMFNSKSEQLFESFTMGYHAINNLAYLSRHPTGYFFKNDLLKLIRIVDRFSNYEYVDLFPLEFVFAELCLLGDGAIYHDSLFSPETEAKVVTKHKSATTNGNSKKAFFSPQTRLKLAVNFEDHIHSLQIIEKYKKQLMINSFFREFHAATLGFKAIMRRKDLCAHYYMESREIKVNELLNIGLNFYKEYSKKVIRIRFKSLPNRLSFKMHLFIILLKTILIRIMRQ